MREEDQRKKLLRKTSEIAERKEIREQRGMGEMEER